MTMAMLLAKKIGMTRIYDEAGNMVPATVMLAGPCIVTQVKTVETDGYNAVQMAFDDIKTPIGSLWQSQYGPQAFCQRNASMGKGCAGISAGRVHYG